MDKTAANKTIHERTKTLAYAERVIPCDCEDCTKALAI